MTGLTRLSTKPQPQMAPEQRHNWLIQSQTTVNYCQPVPVKTMQVSDIIRKIHS